VVSFLYTNYRDEARIRHVLPLTVWYGSTQWHPEPQWLLKALDMENQEERDFALRHIQGWEATFR
jgi:predicted DNA-binding transcriptional regulator YafY